MSRMPRLLAGLASLLFATSGFAQITFFEHNDFRGRQFTTRGAMANLGQLRFNDLTSSIIIDGGLWEVCEHSEFGGRCEVLGPDQYPSMKDFGLNDRISSVRPVRVDRHQTRHRDYREYRDDRPDYAYRRRPDERIYEADVTSVRAVFEDRNRRCWVDDRAEYRRSDEPNVGAAIVGGIIGHQIGDGSGRTAATAAGVAAGAAIGSRAGRDDRGYGYERDMVRCRDSGRGRPTYWDVSYEFRGIEHWVRLSYPPGRTIAVNRHGEPRE